MTLKAKIVMTLVIVLFILTAAGFYSLPYLTVYQIKKAIDQNDSAKLREYIGFQSVRQDLKEQVKAFVAPGMEILRKSKAIEWFGTDLTEGYTDKLMDKIIDNVVTSSGLDELIRGKIILGQISGGEKKPEASQALDVSMDYESLSEFITEIKNQGDPSKGVKLILTRQGLDWKVTAIKLPLDTLRLPIVPDPRR